MKSARSSEDISSMIHGPEPMRGTRQLASNSDWNWRRGMSFKYFFFAANPLPRPRAFVVWAAEPPKTVESRDLDLDPREDRQGFMFRELEVEGLSEETRATKE